MFKAPRHMPRTRLLPVRRPGRTIVVVGASVAAAALFTTSALAPAQASGETGTTSPGRTAPGTSTGTGSDTGSDAVIVMAAPGTEQAVRRRTVELGLRITRQLAVVNGFTAQGPADAAQRLAGTPGVISVTPDRPATPLSLVPSLGYDPDDTGSSSVISRIVGAQQAWAAGYTGTGVDVAVIDTGVAPVAGLNTEGKVLTGPDLSLDAAVGAAAGLDAYGHGTFMAGLIAGRDATATSSATGCTTCLNPSGYSDTTAFVGMAPGARIVNVKVGAADGATDVSQVIAAIDWVTQHAHDPGLNIKVLSLSYGTASTQAYQVDPLAQAAEQAWKHGIVVVAAAGNEGRSAPTLADPAYDPFVLAVGGQETKGTLTPSDDKVPSFAEHGTASRPVDVVAPATHVLGLRVPGSYIDTLTTNKGQVGTRFQRGSGTSQATAIVSGVVALLAQKYPDATPDQLKALVTGTATLLPKTGKATLDAKTLLYSGHGSVNAARALATPLPAARQTAAPSSGLGTLDAARGGVYLADGGVELTGQRDVFGHPFSSAGMALAQTTATSWSGGIWNGSRWSGDGWSSTGWSAATSSGSGWPGTSWAGNDWSGSRWSGMTWDGSRWSGSRWSGSRWSGSRWSGADWSGSRWSGAGWS